MKRMKSLFIVIAVLCSLGQSLQGEIHPSQTADLIIFSFNRPLQLYALLESISKYITNLNHIYVLYRTSSDRFEVGYQEISRHFPSITLAKQGNDPRGDFKPLLLRCFSGSPAEYIMFAVDDDIVKDSVDITRCVQAMQKYNVYGFYLRLGMNITRQYGQNLSIMIPSPVPVEDDILQFSFKHGIGDWAYPHNLDMTIFKKSDIQSFFRNRHYSSPNTLESAWSGAANLHVYALCYAVSKKFMLPLNIVQQDWWVPNENSYSIEELQGKWEQGFCIDISQFDRVNNDCVLMGYRPVFIPRT